MITLEIDPYGLICASGALKGSYKRHIEHQRTTGCPDFMRQAIREHLEGMAETHAVMLVALRGAGYLMNDSDLEPVDLDDLMAIEWSPKPAR